ncbi:interferon-induced protein 44-like [Brachyhypopomus gauderio]|uniref:interferon-induced protein 44-like n=1 Tax=Brachyhypopomus gauderio TaxID=698409 RepID=UPI004043546C
MGSSHPKPEFDSPWRQLDWNRRGKIEAQLKDFQLKTRNVSRLRILLCGQVGAGKSSFINSVESAFEHQFTVRAGEASCVKRYRTYTIKNGSSGTLPFVFNDVMGLEQDGIHTEDIISAMLGHVKEGYEFNPHKPLTEIDVGYNNHPSLDDKAHCLVSVVPANVISQMDESVIMKMNTVSQRANDIGIPHLILMTKVDEACPLVKEDLKKIYTSKKIKEKVLQKMAQQSDYHPVWESCSFMAQDEVGWQVFRSSLRERSRASWCLEQWTPKVLQKRVQRRD